MQVKGKSSQPIVSITKQQFRDFDLSLKSEQLPLYKRRKNT